MAIDLFVASRILGTGAHDDPYRAAAGELGLPTQSQIAQDPDGTMPFPACLSVITVQTRQEADTVLGNPAFIVVESDDTTTLKTLTTAQLQLLSNLGVDVASASTQREVVQRALNRMARQTLPLDAILPKRSA